MTSRRVHERRSRPKGSPASADAPLPRAHGIVGRFNGSPVSPTLTLKTFHAGSRRFDVGVRHEQRCPPGAHGEWKRGSEIRRISLPAGSRTATWFGPSKLT